MSDSKREAVAHRWLRNGIPAETWTAGVPSERQFEAQRHCSNIEGVTWTVEYAYSEATHTAMQRRLEAVGRYVDALERKNILFGTSGGVAIAADLRALIGGGMATHAECCAEGGGNPEHCDCVNRRHTLLLRDGKGDGVSTAEGESK